MNDPQSYPCLTCRRWLETFALIVGIGGVVLLLGSFAWTSGWRAGVLVIIGIALILAGVHGGVVAQNSQR